MKHVNHNFDDSLDMKKKSDRQGHCPHDVGGMTSIKSSSSSSMTMTEVACYMVASFIIFVVCCCYSGAIIGTSYLPGGTISSSSSITNDIINNRLWKASSSNSSSYRRPHFIIHIGPHKTGTTFLQSTLSVESADAILESDNYYYLGTTLHSFFREDKLAFPMTSIFTRTPFEKKDPLKAKVVPLPTLNDDFLGVLQQMQDKQQSGIMVHESIHKLPKEYVQILGERLNTNWDVIVVEGYRPLHDWLVSRFNQFVRDEYEPWIWPDGSAGPFIVRGTDDDCYDCIGLPPNLHFGLISNSDFDNKFVKPYIHRNTSIFEQSLNVWRMYFTDVRVVDMLNLPSRDDGQDPYLMHFVCDIVIGASNLCQRATELSKLTDTDMVSSEFGRAYELLTTWSWQLDLVDHTKHERKQIRREIERYHTDHIDTFAKLNNNSTALLPFICPPDSEIDMLWEWTLSTDKRIFAATYHRDTYSSIKREKALQVSFEKSAHKNKFCAADITILLSEEWKPLFVYLDKVALGEVGYRVVADTTLDNYL